MRNDFSGRSIQEMKAAIANSNNRFGSITLNRFGSITLNGVNPTPVNFVADSPAALLGATAGPFDLSTDGLTVIVTIDGTADTATFNCAAGTSVSAASPSTDISAEVDTKFNIAIDGGAPAEVTLDVTGKNTGALIAAEMQAKIRALGGSAASVTVAYGSSLYTITSATKGTGSSIVVTPAASGSITEELKIGILAGGVETAGTGDFVNAKTATAEEVAAALMADMAGVVATVNNGAVKVTSATAGINSSLVVGAGTANSVLGFTQTATAYGGQGLGFDTGMASTNYHVSPALSGVAVANLAGMGLSIVDKTVNGFKVVCETAAAEVNVDLLVVGSPGAV